MSVRGEASPRTSSRPIAGRPRVVVLAKTRYPDPAGASLRRKLGTLGRHLRTEVVGVGRPGIRRVGPTRLFVLPDLRPPIVGGALFYSLGPVIAVWLAAGWRRSAIVCQSPYEGAGVVALSRLLPRSLRPKVVVEVHGDWRTAARMYGHPRRAILAPLTDRVAEWTLRRADRVRVVAGYAEELVRAAGFTGDIDRFVTFTDIRRFLETPPAPAPGSPRVAFIGVLERYKGADVLLDAWPKVLERVPGATLEIAGEGSLSAALRTRAGEIGVNGSVRFLGTVPLPEVRSLLDRSMCLVLPSRSEGLPRIILEAFARARPVVASDVGGIGELVRVGETGSLVPPEDPQALAEALVALLSDPGRAASLGESGRELVRRRDPAAEFDAGFARLAEWLSEDRAPAEAGGPIERSDGGAIR